MKGFTFIAVSVWLMGTVGLASAQTTSYPNADGQFIEGAAMSKGQIKGRINDQVARVNAASKNGKLTTLAADALLAKLKSIRNKMKADYVENGKKELTGDQKIALNNLLDGTAKSIADKGGFQ